MMKKPFLLFVLLTLAGCFPRSFLTPAPVVDNPERSAEIYVTRDMTAFADETQQAPPYWVVFLDDANIARLEKGQYTKFMTEAGRSVTVGVKKWAQGWMQDEAILVLEPKKKYFLTAGVSANGLRIAVRRMTEEEAAGLLAQRAFTPPE